MHTSDLPLLFDLTKCLAVSLAMAVIGTGACLLLLVSSTPKHLLAAPGEGQFESRLVPVLQGLASFDRIDWWPSWNINLEPDVDTPAGIPDGQVSLAWLLSRHACFYADTDLQGCRWWP